MDTPITEDTVDTAVAVVTAVMGVSNSHTVRNKQIATKVTLHSKFMTRTFFNY